VVTSAQLLAAGFRRPAISKAVAAGWLHRIHQGVYAVGHRALSNEGRWMAAVLACRPGAVLSHRDAAELWGMLRPIGGHVDVTIATYAGRRRRNGIRIHRSPSVLLSTITHESGIPVTTAARTLADLKGVISPGLHRKATRQAEYLKLDLGDILTDHTRSETERRARLICKRNDVPPPESNVPIGPYTVDLFWSEFGLVVEIDSFGTHGGRQGFEDDRAMEMYLTRVGLRLRRFSDTQVWNQPDAVAASIIGEIRQRAS
jgi:hypothetical protein